MKVIFKEIASVIDFPLLNFYEVRCFFFGVYPQKLSCGL